MATVYRVYEGRRFSPEMWAAVSEWRRLARAGGIGFRITQGGFNNGGVAASAGTHDGDAVDLSVSGLTQAQVARLITLGRMVGLFASFRTTSVAKWGTRAQGFGAYHVHAVPNGWGHPSAGARRQIAHVDSRGVKHGYRHGRDGLRGNGPDTGPGHVSTYRTRTWTQYQQLVAPKPGLPSTGVSNPPPGGLTMSDITTILARLDYMQAQIKAVADGTYGRKALNARNADVATIVQAATDAQSRVLLDAFGKLGVPAVDMDGLKAEVRRAVADAMDGATLEITARHDDEEA